MSEEPMPGKRVQFDDETWAAFDLLAKDNMMTQRRAKGRDRPAEEAQEAAQAPTMTQV
jgi:hypothetical protein